MWKSRASGWLRGIEVVGVDPAPYNIEQSAETPAGTIPFPDSDFDLVTSRHESYLPCEVNRVLASDGCFLTQQVASGASDDLYRLIGWPVPNVGIAWNLAFAVRQLEQSGFAIDEAAEGHVTKHFTDIGALAWYLQHMPFMMPGFSIETARDELLRIAEAQKPLIIRQPWFWLKASKLDAAD